MVYQIPPFLMGQAANVDFSPIQNALAQWRQDQRFNAQNALAREKFAEDRRQFDASNALAQGRFGLDQRAAARADELAPYNLQQLKVQIDNARASGAREAELFPLMKQARELEIRLNQAKAEGKDTETQMMRSLGLAGEPAPNALAPRPQGPTPQPQPQLQPQSYAPGQADPNFIRTADGVPGQPAPKAEPSAADVIKGMNPAQRAQFGLSFIGKGDAAKVLGDAADRDKIGKEGMNKIDEEIIAKIGDVAELDNIKKQYRPEFLEIGGRVKAIGASWQAYLNSKSVKPEDRKYLTDYAKFAAASQERMNTRIKAMSGSAVSGHEEVRLNKANPTVNDDPITYEAKLNEQIYLQKAALSRYMWLKNVRGLNHEQIANLAKSGKIESLAGLDDMRRIADERGAQLEQELQGKVPPERMGPIIRQKLKQEFGI